MISTGPLQVQYERTCYIFIVFKINDKAQFKNKQFIKSIKLTDSCYKPAIQKDRVILLPEENDI